MFSILATPYSPATASATFKGVLNNSSLSGQYIPLNMAYPQSRFPSVSSLGLGQILGFNTGNIFPFKDNSLPITEIEAPTTILVLDKATSEIKLQTNKFILQTISKPSQERFQIIETFGEPSVYFYDMRTRVYTIQGILMDAEDVTQLDNMGGSLALNRAKGKYYWTTAFQAFYEDHLRGTQLKQAGCIAAIYINNWFIRGYPIQLVISKDSHQLSQTASFQMTWVIESETLLSRSKAEYLYKQGQITGDTATAINAYLKAMNDYQVAYDAWNRECAGVDDATALTIEKNMMEAKVKTALVNVNTALANSSAGR